MQDSKQSLKNFNHGGHPVDGGQDGIEPVFQMRRKPDKLLRDLSTAPSEATRSEACGGGCRAREEGERPGDMGGRLHSDSRGSEASQTGTDSTQNPPPSTTVADAHGQDDPQSGGLSGGWLRGYPSEHGLCLFFQRRASMNDWAIVDDLYRVATSCPMLVGGMDQPIEEDGNGRAHPPEGQGHVLAPQDPLPHAEVMTVLTMLRKLLVLLETIGRCHAMRKLAPQMAGEVVLFALSIQNRTQEAMQMYAIVRRLSRNSSLHLIAATMRPAMLGRRFLGKEVDRLLQHM